MDIACEQEKRLGKLERRREAFVQFQVGETEPPKTIMCQVNRAACKQVLWHRHEHIARHKDTYYRILHSS